MKKLVCILVFLSCLWGSFAIGFEVGGRVPIGVNAFFLENFIEGYLQAVPSVGRNYKTKFGSY